MEHFRSHAPSVLVICYSLLKGLYSAISLRSYHQLGSRSTAPRVDVLLALLIPSYLMLMFVELVEKRKLLRQKVCLWSS
jgi:ATP-binding cassette subfamily C (CFTR/MRP) protein 1